MGISSLPSPSEGILSIILINTALLIAICQSIFRSILNFIGKRPDSPSERVETPSDGVEYPIATVEYRAQVPSVRWETLVSCPAEQDCNCSVCLARFEPESVVNRLPCGHLFHKACLETWFEYWNVTCPLCRAPLPLAEEISTCPSF